MILVAGGSGRLGTLVVRRLADRGLDVRVLTRDPSRARHLGDAAIDIVAGRRTRCGEPASAPWKGSRSSYPRCRASRDPVG